MEEYNQQSQPANRRNAYQSDTQRLVQKHMADPNHQFTDEELASIRVGMSPGPDVPTQEAISEADRRAADSKVIQPNGGLPGAQKITPWDTVD